MLEDAGFLWMSLTGYGMRHAFVVMMDYEEVYEWPTTVDIQYEHL